MLHLFLVSCLFCLLSIRCLFLAIPTDKKPPEAKINKSSRKFFPWKIAAEMIPSLNVPQYIRINQLSRNIEPNPVRKAYTLKTSSRLLFLFLSHSNFLFSKMSWKCLEKQKITTLTTFWRRLADQQIFVGIYLYQIPYFQ